MSSPTGSAPMAWLRRATVAALLVGFCVGCGGGGGSGGGGGVSGGGGAFVPNFFPAGVRADYPGTGTHSSGGNGGTSMSCNGLLVLVAYHDGIGEAIRANVSTDGARTWHDPDDFVASESQISSLQTCCTATAMHIAWKQSDVLGGRLMVASSSNAGATWTTKRLDSLGEFGVAPAIWCEGQAVHVVWSEMEAPVQTALIRVLHSRSLDAGASWSPPVRISSPVLSSLVGAGALHGEGQNLTVAYIEDGAPGARLKVVRSTDGGGSWGGPTTVATTATGSGPLTLDNAVIVGSGAALHIVWYTFDSGPSAEFSIRSSSSSDGGAIWQASDSLVAANAKLTMVASGSGTSHCAWTAATHAETFGRPQVANATGATWTSSPPLDVSTADGANAGPAIACGAGNVYAAWEVVLPTFQVSTQFAWSSDDGATWSPDVSVGTQGRDGPVQVCADGLHVYVLWRKNNGDRHVYVNASHP